MNIDSSTAARIEGKSKPLEDIVNKIVYNHTAELQSVMHKIRQCTKDDTPELTDIEIEQIMLELPLLLFDVTDDQELVGMQSDFASQLYKEAYNESFKDARGTISDKNTSAELNSMIQKLDSQIYDRAYKIIKQKVSLAIETLNAVKKVQSTRQQKSDLGKTLSRF